MRWCLGVCLHGQQRNFCAITILGRSPRYAYEADLFLVLLSFYVCRRRDSCFYTFRSSFHGTKREATTKHQTQDQQRAEEERQQLRLKKRTLLEAMLGRLSVTTR